MGTDFSATLTYDQGHSDSKTSEGNYIIKITVRRVFYISCALWIIQNGAQAAEICVFVHMVVQG